MHAVRLKLLAFSMLACAQSAYADAPSPAPDVATPVSSPGDWLGTEDYPTAALRFGMAGTTAFRLTVDAAGMPSRCEITQSSGFDLLDAATCERLMANARFTPASDGAGKPVRTYSNRVRWVLPDVAAPPVGETFASTIVSIDETGHVTSCEFVVYAPVESRSSESGPCKDKGGLHPALALELRKGFQGPSAQVENRRAIVFTPAMRDRVLAPMPGYEQRGLNISQFTVTSDGKIGQCRYEEQRGSEFLAEDFCKQAGDIVFDPPFSAIEKDGTAKGWNIMRVMLKTGKTAE